MKFGDKLIQLRKKNGMNQEELAEKLGVSRQSVSKWESNNAYPETDKIVQICNIFNCTMDDLINDTITDINEIQRKDRNNITIAIDSFLEFITKTINMFSNMKFASGLKCVIEMIILALILAFTGKILSVILSSGIGNLFSFMDYRYVIENTVGSLLMLVWIIIEAIILIHTFKIRYLDYYDKVAKEQEDKTEETTNEKVNINNKKQTVVIRDDKHAPFAFLSVLSNIVIIIAKIILTFFAIELVVSLIGSAVALVFSIFLTTSTTLFLGIDISLLAFIIINVIILIFIIGFIFNKKTKYKPLLITALVSIIFIGVGIGLTAIASRNIKVIDDPEFTKTTEERLKYKDNLVIVATNLPDTEYQIDNSLNDIKVEVSYVDRMSTYEIREDTYYGLSTYEIRELNKDLSPKEVYDLIIPDLKKNIIRTNYGFVKIKVTANEDTINKLIDNLDKAYVFDKTQTDNGYMIKEMQHKITEEDYCSEKTDYNAVTGEITTSGDCKCEIKEDNDYLNFVCNYEE